MPAKFRVSRRRHGEGGRQVTMTDPIADMLTRLRNANTAYHDEVIMPSSKLKEALAAILQREGFIVGFSIDENSTRPGRKLQIQMKYTPDRQRTISGIRRVSKPGLRVYTKSDRVPRVLGGMGIAILSTNQGLLTDREARERRVGGEVLCQVW
jgi:small subunit ribosomal protein S8